MSYTSVLPPVPNGPLTKEHLYNGDTKGSKAILKSDKVKEYVGDQPTEKLVDAAADPECPPELKEVIEKELGSRGYEKNADKNAWVKEGDGAKGKTGTYAEDYDAGRTIPIPGGGSASSYSGCLDEFIRYICLMFGIDPESPGTFGHSAVPVSPGRTGYTDGGGATGYTDRI